MKSVLYLGDIKQVNQDIIKKLIRNDLEFMHFLSLEAIEPYLDEDLAKLVFLCVNPDDDHVEIRKLIERLNELAKGRIPLVLVTRKDSLKLRQKYLDLSYAHFLQYSPNVVFLRKNFERLLKELEHTKQMQALRFAIVDDDKLQLHALNQLFKKHGINDVHFFNNPKEIEQVKEEFDVYLIDLIMPEKPGDELIFELRMKYSDAVILAVSSLESSDVISKVLSLGANDYIVKPYNETIFMAKLMSNSRLRYLLKENRHKTKELEEMAVRDPMTDLYNHRKIDSVLLDLNEAYKETGQVYSVIMADVDYFKSINDTYGHTKGDQILIKIAKKLKSLVGPRGYIGRYGGEEFIIILPETREAQAFFMAEKIRRNVENETYDINRKITISLGVAEIKDDFNLIVDKADRMLYKAKRDGRNRVVSQMHVNPY